MRSTNGQVSPASPSDIVTRRVPAAATLPVSPQPKGVGLSQSHRLPPRIPASAEPHKSYTPSPPADELRRSDRWRHTLASEREPDDSLDERVIKTRALEKTLPDQRPSVDSQAHSLEKDHSPREETYRSGENSVSTTLICLCQPDPRIPRPRNGT